MHLADTQAIAFLTRRSAATIRSWAHRGLIKRRGTGTRGRALYAVEDAEKLMTTIRARHIDNQPSRTATSGSRG